MNNLAVFNNLNQILQNSLISILEDCFQATLCIGNMGETPVSAITIYETKTEVILKVRINNIELSTLDIQISPETVLIQGYWSTSENVEGYFRPSQFQTIIPLPYCINPQTVQAELQQNILSIRFPQQGKFHSAKVKLALQQNSSDYREFEYIKGTI